jgi:hypothetical protein
VNGERSLHWVLTNAARSFARVLTFATVACGSARDQSAPNRADGGLSLNLPDAAPSCGELPLGDAGQSSAGACTVLQQRDFTTDIEPLFASCSGEVCHDFSPPGLRATFGATSNECCTKTPLIAPGDPSGSYLLDKLRGEPLCSGDRMPLDKAPFSDAQIQAMSDWICEGAPTR